MIYESIKRLPGASSLRRMLNKSYTGVAYLHHFDIKGIQAFHFSKNKSSKIFLIHI